MLFYRSQYSTILLSCIIVIIAQGGAALNICDWIFCENGGKCQPVANSLRFFECQCPFGFNGLLCENRVNINTCGKNPCKNNGTCSITADRRIKCTCPLRYKGSFCETKF